MADVTATRESLIDELLAAVPGSERASTWERDVQKGGRAVAVVVHDPAGPNEEFALLRLRAFDSDGWELSGRALRGTYSTTLQLAKEWLS
ncbi:hypothetical protein ACT17_06040 [Mycolicibacterium conceptionense]|uniref:Uncharacterized protein n=1 Tax=Mycolicibacterium conceptionense TaxID=451644 RepID=A0A0J8X2B9_9MYCO|nr:hypothetical protein [Mycolicibacterium conceptionense]KMV19604.1 hypothetical protein ACT17_06040 [Mycolicibacterium conceptionense]